MRNFCLSLFLLVCLAPFMHAQVSTDYPCTAGSGWEGIVFENLTDDMLKYCGNTTGARPLAERAWVTANFGATKPSSTGSLTNSALGCASTTVSVSGATVGGGVNVAFTGGSAVPAGLVPSAQITASNTVTVNICAVITLSVASRPFIVNLL